MDGQQDKPKTHLYVFLFTGMETEQKYLCHVQ